MRTIITATDVNTSQYVSPDDAVACRQIRWEGKKDVERRVQQATCIIQKTGQSCHLLSVSRCLLQLAVLSAAHRRPTYSVANHHLIETTFFGAFRPRPSKSSRMEWHGVWRSVYGSSSLAAHWPASVIVGNMLPLARTQSSWKRR